MKSELRLLHLHSMLIVTAVAILLGTTHTVRAQSLQAGVEPHGPLLLERKLQASDGERNDVFGDGVAVRGNLAMVGAPSGTLAKPGSVYVYERQGAQWTETDKIDSSDGMPGDRFGQTIAVRGNRALIGAFLAFDDSRGAAYVFRNDGTDWLEEQKLTATDGAAADALGRSVVLGRDLALVGAPSHDHNGPDSGSVYVYERMGEGWLEIQEILAPDAAAGDQFGSSLAREGAMLFIGANGDDALTGSVYLYRHDGVDWDFEDKLIAPDGVDGDGFGTSVSLSGDTVLIGASQVLSGGTGVVHVFEWNGDRWIWAQKLLSSDADVGDKFGLQLTVQNDAAVIGAPFDDDNGPESGAAYIFGFNGVAWTERFKILPSDGESLQFFGSTVGLSSRFAIVGSPLGHGVEDSAGAAYIYVKRRGNSGTSSPNRPRLESVPAI